MAKYALVLNSGSSSLKYAVVDADSGNTPIHGIAENLNTDRAVIYNHIHNEKSVYDLETGTSADALSIIINIVNHACKIGKIGALSAVGHRITHGGETFNKTAMINEDIIRRIEKCSHLAPLHNPAQLEGIYAAMEIFDHIPHVAVFDTSFHQSMPERAFLYPLPYEYYTKHNIRKYGMHGTSYRYITKTMKNILNTKTPNLIIAHLGSGGSVDAVANGKSADTTMGITPLAGIVHGTRSGDIDPALPQLLADKLKMSLSAVTEILWKESGLLGLSNLSPDCRELQKAAENGHKQAQIALDVYCYRLAKYIAGLMVALPKKPDAIVFTGGIGENSSLIRKTVIEYLSFLDIAVDTERNKNANPDNHDIITTVDSKIPCYVVSTHEELIIARDAVYFSKLPPS